MHYVLKQGIIDQLIDKASKEGRREISFHYLNDEKINILKQNGYNIDNEKCIISW